MVATIGAAQAAAPSWMQPFFANAPFDFMDMFNFSQPQYSRPQFQQPQQQFQQPQFSSPMDFFNYSQPDYSGPQFGGQQSQFGSPFDFGDIAEYIANMSQRHRQPQQQHGGFQPQGFQFPSSNFTFNGDDDGDFGDFLSQFLGGDFMNSSDVPDFRNRFNFTRPQRPPRPPHQRPQNFDYQDFMNNSGSPFDMNSYIPDGAREAFLNYSRNRPQPDADMFGGHNDTILPLLQHTQQQRNPFGFPQMGGQMGGQTGGQMGGFQMPDFFQNLFGGQRQQQMPQPQPPQHTQQMGGFGGFGGFPSNFGGGMMSGFPSLTNFMPSFGFGGH